MSDIAIRVENLSKLYRIGQPVGYKTLRESLMSAVSTPFRRHSIRHEPPAISYEQSEYLLIYLNGAILVMKR